MNKPAVYPAHFSQSLTQNTAATSSRILVKLTFIPSLKFGGPGLGVPHLFALYATLVNMSSSKLSKLISWLSNLSRRAEWKRNRKLLSSLGTGISRDKEKETTIFFVTLKILKMKIQKLSHM